MTARPIATHFPGHGCMDNLTTERSLDSQAMWACMCFAYFLTLFIGVCTTWHWQTSGQLLQELNVFTVTSTTITGIFSKMCYQQLVLRMIWATTFIQRQRINEHRLHHLKDSLLELDILNSIVASRESVKIFCLFRLLVLVMFILFI